MLNPEIKIRIKAAIRADGRSMRTISAKAGLNENFAAQLLRTGREPGIGQLMALCKELNVTLHAVVYGISAAEADRIALKIQKLPKEARRVIEDLIDVLTG